MTPSPDSEALKEALELVDRWRMHSTFGNIGLTAAVALGEAYRAERRARELAEHKIKMARSVSLEAVDMDDNCESPKCGHEHICMPCMTIIRINAELERPDSAATTPKEGKL